MYKIYKELPSNYDCIKKIDMKNNRKEYILINVLTNVIFIPFLIGLAFIEVEFTISPLGILAFLIGVIITIIIHELIHAFFFRIGNKVKVKYKFHGFAASASVPDVYYQKRHYIIITLAPFLILNILYILLILFLSDGLFYLVYFIFAFHLSGCVGDLYVFSKLFMMPKETLIQDYGIGMRFYQIKKLVSK